MISTINGDLFDEISPQGSDEPIIIAHGCNAQGRMRTGFANVIRSKNEGVYEAYYNSGYKLGTVSYFELYPNVFVANCVTQEYFGYDGKKYTSYDAVDQCFKHVAQFAKELADGQNSRVSLMFPKIGAVLGGGNLSVINTIIDVNIDDAYTAKFQYII